VTAAASSAGELTAGDVARLRGWDRATAWRWLVKLEREHGPTVVRRSGRRLYTTAAALARVAPTLGDDRIKARVADLESRVTLQEQRISGLARDLAEALRLLRSARR